MCDLIDLNSPDTKSLVSARLASPLIPAPNDSVCGNRKVTGTNTSQAVSGGERDSLENNPFDLVLHKTTEYIQKKSDPFEVTLQRALETNYRKKSQIRANSVDCTEDVLHNNRRHDHIRKLNRTMDESIAGKETKKNVEESTKTPCELALNKMLAPAGNHNTNNYSLVGTNDGQKIPAINVEAADLSILSQSTLNNTLSDEIYSSEPNLKKDITEQVLNNDVSEKIKVFLDNKKETVRRYQRSYSQSEKISPNHLCPLNRISQSMAENKQMRSLSSSTISSIQSSNSGDPLNDGFLKSQCNDSSVFSSLSNISAITRRTSASSVTNYSIATSNATINRSFLESFTSDKADTTKSSDKSDCVKRTSPVVATHIPNTQDKIHSLMSNLLEKLNKLKEKSGEPCSHEDAPDKIVTVSPDLEKEKKKDDTIENSTNEEKLINEKLIDVDLFVPEDNVSEEHCKSCTSDASSDSVFTETNNINRSIRHEAKVLARTFEELASRTTSGSSSDDLLSANTSWISELLPAFEEEALVDDLIELPLSPNTDGNRIIAQNTQHNAPSESPPQKNNDTTERKQSSNQDLKTELLEFIPSEKKSTVALLLLDLKKLIDTQANIQAHELLESLEKALGIEQKNNIELLTNYLGTTNNLARSPQRPSNSLELIRNVEQEILEKSEEENLNMNSVESSEVVVQQENINLSCMDTNKEMGINQKCIKEINTTSSSHSEKENSFSPQKTENISVKTETVSKDKNLLASTVSTKNDNSSNVQTAVELVSSLAKFLSEHTEEKPTLNLLKNLGKMLNFASDIDNVNENIVTEDECTAIQQTPKKPKLGQKMKLKSPIRSNSRDRRSLNMEIRKESPATNLVRRSTSVSFTPPMKVPSGVSSFKGKNAAHLKEVRKRFPSDPGFINSISSKKGAVLEANGKAPLSAEKDGVTRSLMSLHGQKQRVFPIATTVNNKLKKKPEREIVNKKGPLKAIVPIAKMQRKDSFTAKPISPPEEETPSKSPKIISSTPNSIHGIKKSPRSKPVASSTPDSHISKICKMQTQPLSTSKKRNFSCDISPVTTKTNIINKSVSNSSPKKSKGIPSPRRSTPKRPAETGIPKSVVSPVLRRGNSSFEFSQRGRNTEKVLDSDKDMLVSEKSKISKVQQSPLRENNQGSPKVKPFNLISKLRHHSASGSVLEKENNYL